MRTKTATTPDGEVWRVGVAWLPRRKSLVRRWWRRRKETPDGVDADPGGCLDIDELFILVAALAALALLGWLLWWILIPAVLLVIDALLLAVLVPAGVLARVLLGRPWIVEACSATAVHRVPVVGWGKARETRDDLVRRIAGGWRPSGTETDPDQ